MKTVSKLFTVILTSAIFCLSSFSSLAMNEEQLNSITPKSIHPTISSTEGNDVVERLRQLSLRPIPKPTILNERLLSAPDQHVQFLKAALRSAYERVVIVSPYISVWRLREEDKSGFYDDIEEATQRGVKVTVFTDSAFDEGKPNAVEGRKNLVKAHADLRIVDRIHSKNLIVDDNLITFGSFNWLSAVINPTNAYCRYETSTILKDDYAPIAIQRILRELDIIPLRDMDGYHAFYVESEPAVTDFREAIKLYKKYVAHPLYKPVTQALMSSHADSGLKEGLAIIRTLQQTGATTEKLLGEIWALTEFHVGNACEFLEILKVLVPINPRVAMDVAMDKRTGFLSRINRTEDYDNLESIYGDLSRIGMDDLARKVELYILTGEREN